MDTPSPGVSAMPSRPRDSSSATSGPSSPTSDSPHSSQRWPTPDAQQVPSSINQGPWPTLNIWRLPPLYQTPLPTSKQEDNDITNLSARQGAPSFLSLHLLGLLGFLIQSLVGPPQLQKGPSGLGPAAPSQRRLPEEGVRKKELLDAPLSLPLVSSTLRVLRPTCR